MSSVFVTLVLRMLYVSTLSLRFLAARDHCPPATILNVSAHRVFGRPILLLPVLTSHTDVARGHLLWSILATWSPPISN
jgi:hypothetical protein